LERDQAVDSPRDDGGDGGDAGVAVKTERLESVVAEEQANKEWGLSVRDVTRRICAMRGCRFEGGAGDRRDQQPAGDRAQILPDDIILSINGATVTNVEEFDDAIATWAKNPRAMAVVVRRDRNELTRVVKPREINRNLD